MTQIVSNIIQKSFEGFVSGAVSTVGEYAGDAIAGLGDYVERTGDYVGTGIANKFDGWGQSISGPNGSINNSSVAKSAAAPTKQVQSGATNQRKAITARSQSFTTTKTTSKAVSKAGVNTPKPARTNSDTTVLAKTKPVRSTVKKQNTSTAAPKSSASKPTAFAKANTNAAGKVIPQKSSLTQSKAKALNSRPATQKPTNSATYKGPIPIGNTKPGGTEFKPHGGYESWKPKPKDGYQGPLNLGGLQNTGSNQSSSKSAANKQISTAKGTNAPKAGTSYQGPLKLGSLA